ncbi:hypothetical protein WH297_11075 [Ochrobactrum vermis]|uniref:Uncharacterized protein n=1 Tax=Ochrobactrum vermis TaxID=1827297 RepID=A0ABU8PDF7_9HYPH|nr:hypothetical protein [Ochrobactrum vermis]
MAAASYHAAVYRFQNPGQFKDQKDRSTVTRRTVDEMDVMARKFPFSIPGVFAVLPMGDLDICFVAFCYAKPLRTFTGTALSSVAGQSGQI